MTRPAKATKWRESSALMVHQLARWTARRCGLSLAVVVVRGGHVSAGVERRDPAHGGFNVVARRRWEANACPNTPTGDLVREAQQWCEQTADGEAARV